jgi:hypothetical protein
MSDPMTNVDSDDVLASIRRLVSQTHVAPAVTPVPDAIAQATPSDRLILTPNFRVNEPAPEIEKASQSVELPDGIDTREDAVEVQPFVLEAHDAVSGNEEPQAPYMLAAAERSEDAADAELSSQDMMLPENVETTVNAAPNDEADGGVEQLPEWQAVLDDTPDAQAADHVAGLTLEQRIAELESAVGEQSQDWEPDGSEDETADMAHGFSEAGARVLHFRGAEAVAAVEDAAQDDVVSSDFDAAEQRPPEAADITSKSVDEGDDFEASNTEDFAPAGYAQEDVFDEDALRELISIVLREELQGVLGERITRNVRRLVRKEVQSALTLKNFE